MTTSTPSATEPAAVEQPSRRMSRWQRVVGALGLVVVFWVGDRLYDVIDRGSTVPGTDHRPGGRAPTSQPTVPDHSRPGGGGGGDGHDPSQFDHR